MLDQATKRKLDSARQILVGKVPDPKAQVEQITTALVYKFMDDMDKESEELGGKAKFFANGFAQYAWTKLLDNKLSGQGRLDLYVQAITNMPKNPHIPQLFRDIFKDVQLPYRDSFTLNLFLKEINEFNYEHSENLGDAYEYLLSIMGSQGDAGQFRTPRHLIDFIVEIVDPKKNETILDPACGTAGFLISAYKHILKSNKEKSLTPQEKENLMKNFTGYDISPEMVRMSLVNLYLHGFPIPNITEYDTLTSEKKWDEEFDVILANPPFMTPKGGIRPHKRFSIDAKRAEILFVDYIQSHLKIKGKAGIIVPEGVLHNNYTSFKNLRSQLIEKNLLYAIIELPHGVFKPYASAKTHILLFDRDIAKTKDEILFLIIKNDGFTQTDARRPIEINDLPKAKEIIRKFKTNNIKIENDEIETLLVKKKMILTDKKTSLLGRRYKAITEAEQSKFPVVRLDKRLVKIEKGKSPTEQTESGDYDFIVTAKESKTADHFDFEGKAVCVPLVSSTGHGHASIRRLHFANGKFALANIMCAIFSKDENKLDSKYLYYILNAKKDSVLTPLMSGTSNVSMDKDDIYDIEIPLPDIQTQLKIVEQLDKKQLLVEKLIKEAGEIEISLDNESLLSWG